MFNESTFNNLLYDCTLKSAVMVYIMYPKTFFNQPNNYFILSNYFQFHLCMKCYFLNTIIFLHMIFVVFSFSIGEYFFQ